MSPGLDVLHKNKGPTACTTCAKAKARCIPGPDGCLKCDRCNRLNKPCLLQTPAPPRLRKSPKLSKIAALERRLEELSSQVNDPSAITTGSSTTGVAGGANGSSTSDGSTPSPKQESLSSELCAAPNLDMSHLFPTKATVVAGAHFMKAMKWADESSSVSSMAESDNQHQHQPRYHHKPGPSLTPQPHHQYQNHHQQQQAGVSWWPSPDEAEALLQDYLRVHAGLFPFVLVPEGMSAAELRRRRPFMWKAVMMVSCFLDGTRQMKLGEELLVDVAQAAIVQGCKSLDLLHGLQTLVAWFHYSLKGPQLTNLLFLARSLCVGLALKDDASLQGEERSRNLENIRAYAGTYYINTLVFTTNKRPDVLMTTSFLETCCTMLELSMEYPSDEYLVKLVRIQQLAQSISQTMAIDNISQHAMKLPLTIVVSSFQEQLDNFHNSLPPHIASKHALQCHINVAQMLLYEIALSDQHSTASYVPLTDRLQLLWSCVRALKSFFDVRFAHRELERPRFICLSASDFVFAILMGLKLVTLQLPGWNLAHIQAELGIVEVMDSQIGDLVLIIMRRKQAILPALGGAMAAVNAHLGASSGSGARGAASLAEEDPFERLLRRLKTLRDLVKLELDRTDDGAGVTVVPFGQDMMVAEISSDFWQEVDNVDILGVDLVGDPDALTAGFA